MREAINEQAKREGVIYQLGGGGEATSVIQGQFRFDGALAPQWLKVLPPLIHLKAREGKPLEWLRLTSHFLMQELREPKPGSVIMISRLLDLVFVQAVRDWGAKASGGLGWLGGLADPAIGKALAAIHDEPAFDWTVEGLANIAGLSRSAFAARFAARVGQPPLAYIGAWRLDLAADHLRAGAMTIGQIARDVGYASEPAFTRAFKARFATTPAIYRRDAGRK